MKATIVYDEYGDWEGLYIDGKLVDEGHTLSTNRVLRALKIEFSSLEIDMEKLDNDLPEDLEKVLDKI